jgi:hypothetical protein
LDKGSPSTFSSSIWQACSSPTTVISFFTSICAP